MNSGSASEMQSTALKHLPIVFWRTTCRGASREADPFFGDEAAHDDGLHLPPGLCDCRVSWHAYRVARAPSFHLLLAHLHPSCAPRTKNVGRDGQVDACYHHRLALWTLAQSRVLERASPRELVGAGSPDHLAATH